jgi:hypothetical protein
MINIRALLTLGTSGVDQAKKGFVDVNKEIDKGVDKAGKLITTLRGLTDTGGGGAGGGGGGGGGGPSSTDRYRRDRSVTGARGAAGREFSGLAGGAGGQGIVAAYAEVASKIFAVTAAFQALSSASKVEQLVKGLDALGASSGQTFSIVAKGLQEITGYGISAADALRATAMATSAGLDSDSIERLGRIAKGASIALGRDLSDSFDRLTRGVIKLEPELLDEIGIMVRLDDAVAQYAAANNKAASSLTNSERRQAFLNAVMAEGAEKFGDIADSVEVSSYDKLSASVRDLGTSFLNIINTAIKPFVDLLAAVPAIGIIPLVGLVGVVSSKLFPDLSSSILKIGSSFSIALEKAENFNERLEELRAETQTSIATIESKGIDLFVDNNTDATTKQLGEDLANTFQGGQNPEKAVAVDLLARVEDQIKSLGDGAPPALKAVKTSLMELTSDSEKITSIQKALGGVEDSIQGLQPTANILEDFQDSLAISTSIGDKVKVTFTALTATYRQTTEQIGQVITSISAATANTRGFARISTIAGRATQVLRLGLAGITTGVRLLGVAIMSALNIIGLIIAAVTLLVQGWQAFTGALAGKELVEAKNNLKEMRDTMSSTSEEAIKMADKGDISGAIDAVATSMANTVEAKETVSKITPAWKKALTLGFVNGNKELKPSEVSMGIKYGAVALAIANPMAAALGVAFGNLSLNKTFASVMKDNVGKELGKESAAIADSLAIFGDEISQTYMQNAMAAGKSKEEVSKYNDQVMRSFSGLEGVLKDVKEASGSMTSALQAEFKLPTDNLQVAGQQLNIINTQAEKYDSILQGINISSKERVDTEKALADLLDGVFTQQFAQAAALATGNTQYIEDQKELTKLESSLIALKSDEIDDSLQVQAIETATNAVREQTLKIYEKQKEDQVDLLLLIDGTTKLIIDREKQITALRQKSLEILGKISQIQQEISQSDFTNQFTSIGLEIPKEFTMQFARDKAKLELDTAISIASIRKRTIDLETSLQQAQLQSTIIAQEGIVSQAAPKSSIRQRELDASVDFFGKSKLSLDEYNKTLESKYNLEERNYIIQKILLNLQKEQSSEITKLANNQKSLIDEEIKGLRAKLRAQDATIDGYYSIYEQNTENIKVEKEQLKIAKDIVKTKLDSAVAISGGGQTSAALTAITNAVGETQLLNKEIAANDVLISQLNGGIEKLGNAQDKASVSAREGYQSEIDRLKDQNSLVKEQINSVEELANQWKSKDSFLRRGEALNYLQERLRLTKELAGSQQRLSKARLDLTVSETSKKARESLRDVTVYEQQQQKAAEGQMAINNILAEARMTILEHDLKMKMLKLEQDRNDFIFGKQVEYYRDLEIERQKKAGVEKPDLTIFDADVKNIREREADFRNESANLQNQIFAKTLETLGVELQITSNNYSDVLQGSVTDVANKIKSVSDGILGTLEGSELKDAEGKVDPAKLLKAIQGSVTDVANKIKSVSDGILGTLEGSELKDAEGKVDPAKLLKAIQDYLDRVAKGVDETLKDPILTPKPLETTLSESRERNLSDVNKRMSNSIATFGMSEGGAAQYTSDMKSIQAQRDSGAMDETTFKQRSKEAKTAANALSMAETAAAGLDNVLNTIQSSATDAFMGLIDGSKSAKQAFGEMALSILKAIAQMIVEMLVLKLIQSTMGMFGVPMASGGVMPAAAGGVIPLASGGVMDRSLGVQGVVKQPTYLVGEGRYNEAVVPLPNGRAIPVQMHGGGASQNNNVAVNVNISNSGQVQTETQGQDMANLGSIVASAVQKELMAQKMPGGMLNRYGSA